MSDISMCGNGEKCPKRNSCYRYIAERDEYRQSYIDYYERGKICDSYWKARRK